MVFRLFILRVYSWNGFAPLGWLAHLATQSTQRYVAMEQCMCANSIHHRRSANVIWKRAISVRMKIYYCRANTIAMYSEIDTHALNGCDASE